MPDLTPLDILRKIFGHQSFRASQHQIIDHLLTDDAPPDTRPAALVMMPTGMGKSLCYQVPALCLPGMTVVLSPLIALMKG